MQHGVYSLLIAEFKRNVIALNHDFLKDTLAYKLSNARYCNYEYQGLIPYLELIFSLILRGSLIPLSKQL